MAANDVMLGGGYASGMFYTAPAGTAIPNPGASLSAWTKVGDIDEDGITFTPRDSSTLKNWAGQPKRVIPGTDPGTVKGNIMDMTETVLKTVFGSSNVTVIPAGDGHGRQIKVALDSKPAPAAYLFVMKDGDRLTHVGATDGLISELGDISYKGTEAVLLGVTIQGDWYQITDDGDIES